MAKAAVEKLSAAEQYAQIKENAFERFLNQSFSAESLKGVDLFEVTAPSGMKFKIRKLGPEYLANGGSMPLALAGHITTDKQPQTDEDKAALFHSMSEIERRAGIQASCQMLQYICVEPRLVNGEVNGHRNAISVQVLTMDDFNFLCNVAQGGDAAEGLKTFRRKRR